MIRGKATHQQLKEHNRQLLLRAVYEGAAESRAALALETGLTKPAVSDLIAELIAEGFLEEGGRGQSTDTGGKRPRLLRFVPEARQVIGISVEVDQILGVLSNLDGQVVAEHFADLSGITGDEAISTLKGVIDGLRAQLDAPLLCLGIGVPGIVNVSKGVILHSAPFGWRNVPLAKQFSACYGVPAYIDNNTELAAIAQFATVSNENNVRNLVVVRIDHDLEIGVVLDGGNLHYGSDIGFVRIAGGGAGGGEKTLETFLGWSHIQCRAAAWQKQHEACDLPGDRLTYLDIRHCANRDDPVAVALRGELTYYLAQLFVWIIGLLRPDHIALAGDIVDLGPSLLKDTVKQVEERLYPELIQDMTFSLAESLTLSARGAVARTIRKELGIL